MDYTVDCNWQRPQAANSPIHSLRFGWDYSFFRIKLKIAIQCSEIQLRCFATKEVKITVNFRYHPTIVIHCRWGDVLLKGNDVTKAFLRGLLLVPKMLMANFPRIFFFNPKFNQNIFKHFVIHSMWVSKVKSDSHSFNQKLVTIRCIAPILDVF